MARFIMRAIFAPAPCLLGALKQQGAPFLFAGRRELAFPLLRRRQAVHEKEKRTGYMGTRPQVHSSAALQKRLSSPPPGAAFFIYVPI